MWGRWVCATAQLWCSEVLRVQEQSLKISERNRALAGGICQTDHFGEVGVGDIFVQALHNLLQLGLGDATTIW